MGELALSLPGGCGLACTQSEGVLGGLGFTVNDLVPAADPVWVRLPVAQLGSGHLKGTQGPGKDGNQRGVETWAQRPQKWPPTSLLSFLEWAPRPPPGSAQADLILTLNSPEGPVAVGFGGAWQQVGTLWGEGKEEGGP